MTERLSAERLAEIRRAPDEGIRDIVRDSYTVMLRQLLAELDAVTQELTDARQQLALREQDTLPETSL